MESFRYFPFFERKVIEGDNFFNYSSDFEKLGLGSFITCSGNENSLWFGSGDGYIYEVGLKDGLLCILESWKAYEVTVFDIKYTQNTLITIGIDLNNRWKLKLYDCIDGNILSSRIDNCQELDIYNELGDKGINVFEACNDNQFIGLGTVDDFGVFILYGDFFGVKSYSNYFIELSEPCTSIQFISSKLNDECYIMICTKNTVSSYLIDGKNKYPKLIYCDNMGGCKLNCSSILYNWIEDTTDIQDVLVIFREEGLFCYHPINGNCSALPTNCGNPIILSSFKNYLVLVSNPLNLSTNDKDNKFIDDQDSNITSLCDVTICNYLPELRCICYTGEYNNVSHVIKGLNMLFILCSGTTKNYNYINDTNSNNSIHENNTDDNGDITEDNNNITTMPNLLFHLDELNIFERIQILINKNLYEWALILAKNENVNNVIYNQIQRSYGDWLCNIKKDYNGALSYYLKCLDSSCGDTSHVIHNFIQANRLDEAITYLKECVLIARRNENKKIFNLINDEESRFPIGKDHISLLYKLFAQLDRLDDILEFLQYREINEEIDNFEIDIAIEMCRNYNKFDMAVKISEIFQFHDKYMSIQIEDKKAPNEALNYLQDIKLEETQKLSLILKYGPSLMNNIHKDTTKFIKSLVIDHQMPIDVFLPIFVDQDKLLLEMSWEILTGNGLKQDISLEDIESFSEELCIYLLQVSLRQEYPVEDWSKKIIERLIRTNNSENWHSILCICIYYKYNFGILYICQHCDLYQFAISQYIKKDDIQGLIDFCKISGNKEPFIWQESLSLIIKQLSSIQNQDKANLLINYLKTILENIYSLKLLSPLSILDIFSKYLNNTQINLDLLNIKIIKPILQQSDYFLNFKNENRNSINDYQEIKNMRMDINHIKNKPKILNTSRCNQCHLPLELPVIHFLCEHSFHRYCLLQQNQCPICSSEQQTKIKLLRQRENQQNNKEQFFKFIKGDVNSSAGFEHISKSISVLFK